MSHWHPLSLSRPCVLSITTNRSAFNCVYCNFALPSHKRRWRFVPAVDFRSQRGFNQTHYAIATIAATERYFCGTNQLHHTLKWFVFACEFKQQFHSGTWEILFTVDWFAMNLSKRWPSLVLCRHFQNLAVSRHDSYFYLFFYPPPITILIRAKICLPPPYLNISD